MSSIGILRIVINKINEQFYYPLSNRYYDGMGKHSNGTMKLKMNGSQYVDISLITMDGTKHWNDQLKLLLQEQTCIALLDRRNVFRGTCSHNPATAAATFRPHVYYIVSHLYHVHIVLYH